MRQSTLSTSAKETHIGNATAHLGGDCRFPDRWNPGPLGQRLREELATGS